MYSKFSISIRFATGFSFPEDRYYSRHRAYDCCICALRAEVFVDEWECETDDPIETANIEMILLECDGLDVPWYVFDCYNYQSLFDALYQGYKSEHYGYPWSKSYVKYCGGDQVEIPSEVRRRYGLRHKNVLIVKEIGTLERIPLDEWLPHVFTRYREMFNFHGAVVIEQDKLSPDDANACDFVLLDPGPVGPNYHILDYRARRKKRLSRKKTA